MSVMMMSDVVLSMMNVAMVVELKMMNENWRAMNEKLRTNGLRVEELRKMKMVL